MYGLAASGGCLSLSLHLGFYVPIGLCKWDGDKLHSYFQHPATSRETFLIALKMLEKGVSLCIAKLVVTSPKRGIWQSFTFWFKEHCQKKERNFWKKPAFSSDGTPEGHKELKNELLWITNIKKDVMRFSAIISRRQLICQMSKIFLFDEGIFPAGVCRHHYDDYKYYYWCHYYYDY